MKHHTCKHCKFDFVSLRSDSQFCSHECKHLYRRSLSFERLQEMMARGMTSKEIRIEVGCSRSSVNAAFHRFGIPFGPREKVDVEKLRALAPKGLKQEVFARRVGISAKQMPTALRRHGLYRTWQQARFKKCSSPGAATSTSCDASSNPTTESSARFGTTA
jgi:hypothetical protein